MTRRLLVCVRELDQRRLTPRAPENGHPGGQGPPGIPHRHAYGWPAREWRVHLAIVAVRRVEVTDQSRRVAPGRVDDGVEAQTVQRRTQHSPDISAKLNDLCAPGLRVDRRGRALSALEAHLHAGMKASGAHHF